MMEQMRQHLGVDKPLWYGIGAAEVVAAVGILVAVTGLWPTAALFSAIGMIALMVGAIAYHRRAGDGFDQMLGPLVIIALAVICLTLPKVIVGTIAGILMGLGALAAGTAKLADLRPA